MQIQSTCLHNSGSSRPDYKVISSFGSQAKAKPVKAVTRPARAVQEYRKPRDWHHSGIAEHLAAEHHVEAPAVKKTVSPARDTAPGRP